MTDPSRPRIYAMPFVKVHGALVAKAERKGRSRAEVDEIICWLTGHDPASLAAALGSGVDCEGFFAAAPALNPAREAITGVVCGVRVEAVADPTMRVIRQLDKLIDELARGWPMQRILREERPG